MDPMGYLPIVVRVGMVVAQSSQMYACNYRDSMGMRLDQPPTKVVVRLIVLLFAVTMLVSIMPRSLRKKTEKTMTKGCFKDISCI